MSVFKRALLTAVVSIAFLAQNAASAGRDVFTIRDLSVFDLTDAARPTLTNYLVVTKARNTAVFEVEYGSSSVIEFSCLTQECSVVRSATDPGRNLYKVRVDFEREPVGREVTVVIRGVYNGGFTGAHSESASTYTDESIRRLRDLQLFVLLPKQRTINSATAMSMDYAGDNRRALPATDFKWSKESAVIRLRVSAPTPNRRYEVTWQW